MPTDDFQKAVMEKLSDLSEGQGAIHASQELTRNQIVTLFHKIEGNGQPGLSQRLTVIESTCRSVQAQKANEAADAYAKRGNQWMLWTAVISALLGSIITGVIEIFYH